MTTPNKAEVAYTALKQAIIEQALQPGTKLPEDALGTHFQVSRTLVREALARLAAEGLVDAQHNRTATVARPSLEEARSVFEVRRCLEQEVVRLVIERWSPFVAQALEEHVRLEEQAAREQQAPACARLAGEFHVRLAQLVGNPVLERYVDEVVSRCSLILAVHGRPHSPECGITEHRALIDAFRKGDLRAARRLMASHLGELEARVLNSTPVAEDADLGQILGRYAPGAKPAVRPSRRKA